jgi:hypothetical protein
MGDMGPPCLIARLEAVAIDTSKHRRNAASRCLGSKRRVVAAKPCPIGTQIWRITLRRVCELVGGVRRYHPSGAAVDAEFAHETKTEDWEFQIFQITLRGVVLGTAVGEWSGACPVR